MKKNVTVNNYSVKIDYYDKNGYPTKSEIHYDNGKCISFLFLSNNRGVRGYEYYE